MSSDSRETRVLIAEDDPDISRILRSYAERDGYEVVLAVDGQQALAQFRAAKPDIVLLDINMPKLMGFEVIEKIRAINQTPILVISARNDDQDKLNGLGLGADDYIVKPFNPNEVMARLEAVLRRTRTPFENEVLRFGNLELNSTEGWAGVRRGDEMVELSLTPSEFRLLQQMIRAPRKVFSRLELLESCFPDSEALERTVDSHVSHLRRKLRAAGETDLLTVKRALGYRLSAWGP